MNGFQNFEIDTLQKIPYGANVRQYKILMNGVVRDFDK